MSQAGALNLGRLDSRESQNTVSHVTWGTLGCSCACDLQGDDSCCSDASLCACSSKGGRGGRSCFNISPMGSSSRLSASMTGDMDVAFLILNPMGLCPPKVKRSVRAVSSVSLLTECVAHRTALGGGSSHSFLWFSPTL